MIWEREIFISYDPLLFSVRESQRTANASIWLAYSLKSNFSELPQDSVFVSVFTVEK